MICANGIGVSTIFWRFLEERFADERPVITWDYRGHGNSEFPRDLADLTMESNADDLARVLDAYGYQRAIALGHSMGCQVIYEFANRHRDRAAMLVPMLGTYGRPVHTFLDQELPSLVSFAVSYHVGLRVPDLVSRVKRRLFASTRGRAVASKLARLAGLVHHSHMPQDCLEDYLDHFAVQSPLVFLRMAEKMAAHTAEHYLGELQVPTLVVAGGLDIFTPLYLSEEVAAKLPQSELLVLPEGSHAALVEQPDVIHDRIATFMTARELDGAPLARTSSLAMEPAGS
jgi:pimeloyl-ACP methyl ester carboxylesterase